MNTSERIRFRCSHCDKALNAPQQHAGKTAKCPGCGTSIRIPAPPAPGPAWNVYTTEEAFQEGQREGLIPDHCEHGFAKIVPAESHKDVDIDIVGRARCQGCGHLNAFTLHFSGASIGSAGCGCEKCQCLMTLGYGLEGSAIWLYCRMVTTTHEAYDAELKIDKIQRHHYEVPPEDDENVQELIRGMNQADYHGNFPIHHAASDGKISTLKALLAAGDDINRKNTQSSRGETPLHAATVACLGKRVPKSRLVDTIRFLLKHGADPNKPDNSGGVPLHSCATDPELLRILIAAGANVNAPDKRGWRPLHVAAYNGCVETVKILLSSGAEPNVSSKDGESPLKFAANPRDGDGPGVQKVLRAHGARS
ncbi:MAG: ankyrin repeat domain-containing protein [Planctomycetaceae bacterium]|nr:ankyrin repeat domain-containing protein [Planctomycetaceae bacterium]